MFSAELLQTLQNDPVVQSSLFAFCTPCCVPVRSASPSFLFLPLSLPLSLSLLMSSKSKSEGMFNVESISAERLFRGRAQYLVSWEGYDDKTWEYASTIEHTPAFRDYMKAKKASIVSIAESRRDKGALQYRVAYPAMKDIWEPASFVKGTKALRAFHALQKSSAAESESITSSEERPISTPAPASSISTSAPASLF